ncbi:NADH-quinone oxidoreductase subunit C [Pseudomethylobacillus aquaticus]|uniref:NADH-quinone oxidoreductase subunit C n=1 Tax=Pseudomethylobacillus aquaticus TaxID=2676064 RepID=A0A3N0V100_9PROT|nr:NADH-quinone oxidoreductase subunit C [Pseudomethylobacillus aquaticus]ROH86201.1 NADH-quinone oxidoreductase subunit C [Pseudomethylobacillus aquaticus]
MSARLQKLQETLSLVLGGKLVSITSHVGELTLVCQAESLIQTMTVLRDQDEFRFEQLIDLCGVDYADFGQNDLGENTWSGARYAVVYHLLSVSLNQRLRVRVFANDDFFPMLPTMVQVWPVANWFEREAFDLYGIMFEGHPDLRRLLTDYGFVGHPFRKDFPMIGNVEMRYDPEQQRVIYQPVSIELRNNVPRVIRDEGFHRG